MTFHHDICVGCGACAANCPAKVITMKDHRPYADYSSCIRCYCTSRIMSEECCLGPGVETIRS
ncbi:MAG: 4Fe-4S binding protein [Clostridia bacterium]